ncbi:MAG: hypothetical protein CVV30_01415 [Methanomicrobiales archaeon HGW-Methanomicrobiales-1]|jgi:hypothetical protein|nr:MAG: hypothetical protein CVV30_01415 [Methanomicrobiales archaeon HGW-Methanomicrobiales-1]
MIRTSPTIISHQYTKAYSLNFDEDAFSIDTYDFTKRTYESIVKIIEAILSHFETDYSTTLEYEYISPTQSSLYSLDFLSHIYIPNIDEISGFILDHEDILPVILNGCKLATEIFDKDTELSLEVSKDLESGFQFLVLNVRKKQYPHDIMETIDGLCDTFWNDVIGKSAYFIISTDFQPPVEMK